jgi:preprotein translocase subunit SecY
MIKIRKRTAAFAAIIAAIMVGRRKDVENIWNQLKAWEKVFWAVVVSLVVGGTIVVFLADIVWKWGNWLFGAIGF